MEIFITAFGILLALYAVAAVIIFGAICIIKNWIPFNYK